MGLFLLGAWGLRQKSKRCSTGALAALQPGALLSEASPREHAVHTLCCCPWPKGTSPMEKATFRQR